MYGFTCAMNLPTFCLISLCLWMVSLILRFLSFKKFISPLFSIMFLHGKPDIFHILISLAPIFTYVHSSTFFRMPLYIVHNLLFCTVVYHLAAESCKAFTNKIYFVYVYWTINYHILFSFTITKQFCTFNAYSFLNTSFILSSDYLPPLLNSFSVYLSQQNVKLKLL